MEFFHNPQVDWMGKKKYFITVSIILLVAGIVSLIARGGIKYGIDFRGGTLVYVKFAQAPDLNAIRSHLDAENLHGASLVRYGSEADNEIMIGLDLQTTTHMNALDQGKKDIVVALTSLYGKGVAGKVDFNNAGTATLSNHLLANDPLGLAAKGQDTAQAAYTAMAQNMVAFRNSTANEGLITNFNQLSAVQGVTPKVISILQNDFYLSQFSVFNTQIVGPKVGARLRRQALYVVLGGLAAMLIYVWFRFELTFGVAAIIATFHDVVITLGIFSILDKDISLTVIAAFLTLIGYSMNDTIVTFDRIRENMRLNKKENFRDLVNRSINQVLSRTILTSGLTFIAVLALFLFGGEVIHGFSLVLVAGVIIGTYSSFAIASPLVMYWENQARARVGGGSGGKPVVKPAPPPQPASPAKRKPGRREPAGIRR
ncbi:MAG: protein translocase subunit SecF [Acidobacteriota bacterium]|nr:protein translocase subunit SecF [Acidobacteriota bacterium]